MNHVNTNEALAKVVSISGFIESFAKDMAKTKIDVMPITMIGHDDSIFSIIDEKVPITMMITMIASQRAIAVQAAWNA